MKTKTALASLSQQLPHTAVAACTLTLTPLDATAPAERVHLLPDGLFKARDGRPHDVASGHWLMDEQAFAALTAAAGQRQNDFVFDYEHQTLHKETNGQPAPAAGWFTGLAYVPGEGLFASGVRWTDRAAAHISAGEYRYTSCVFHYDRITGRVLQVMHAALTNDPGLDGLRAIAALTAANPNPADTGDSAVNDALKRLLAQLGINVEGVDFSDAAALTAAVAQAETAIAALTANSGQVAALTNQINTLKAAPAAVDPTQYVPIAVADELRTQLAALSVQHQGATTVKVIADARAAGKLLASEEAWALEFVKTQGLAALTAVIDKRPAIAALTAAPQSQQHQQEQHGTAALTAEEQAVCAATGLSHEAYLAAKKES